jgi:hypothetical protein
MSWSSVDRRLGFRRAAFGVAALLLALAGTPSSCPAYDAQGFPTTEDELKEWFPAQETDADPLSDHEQPPPLNIPGIPWTMQDRADDYRANT